MIIILISKLTINGFGNIENKTIEFKPAINLLQAKNETGKSTIANFIKAMLYGIGKNKDGNEMSETDKYKPWNEDANFSGAMEYTINDKKYLLQRNFSSNTGKVFDENGNDISSSFDKTKSRGIEVGFSQLGIDEETFESTTFVMQKQVDMESQTQSTMIQKLTNMIQSGNENQSYEKTRKKIEKLLYDEVGTNRTATKPKYICTKELEVLENKKDQLILNRKRQENIDEREKELQKEISNAHKDYDECNTIYKIKSKYDEQIEKAKLKFDAEIKAKEELKQKRQEELNKKKLVDTILILAGTILVIVAFIIIKDYVYSALSLIVGILSALINAKVSYKEQVEVDNDNFDVLSEDIRKKKEKELKDMVEAGVGQLYIEDKTQSLKNNLEDKKKLIDTLELESHKLKIEADSLKESIDNLNDVTEQIQNKKHELNEINKKEKIYNLALEKLEQAYEELRSSVIPEIEENIRESIYKTTDARYSDVKFNDETGLLFKNTQGSFEKINRLSLGTIDQMYLGFRLAIAKKYEKVPMVFDETFVYFDDERLENILKVIDDISKERQVIILTCSSREKQALDKLKIKYEKIEM